MPQPLWDASALAKRYAPENGSDTVDAIFVHVPQSQMVTTFLSYAETFSLLLRKQNRGDIGIPAFRTAVSSLQAETLDSPAFNLLTITDGSIVRGVEFMQRHNINASDAAILAAYLRYALTQPVSAGSCILVASDQRLLRAAAAEGLATLNPELIFPADVPALLAAL